MAQHTIKIGEEILEGETKELAIMLRQAPYDCTMTQIGDLLGQSRANISLVLSGTEYAGRKVNSVPVISLDTLRVMRDEEILEKYPTLSKSALGLMRDKTGIKHPRKLEKINLEYRQRLLVEALFGAGYLPDLQFEEVMQNLVEKLFTVQNQIDVIMNFYFDETLDTPTQKVYRHNLKQRIKKYVESNMKKGDIKKLVQQGVLIKK